ncbi:PAS domain-containing protein [Porphyromonas somerae]|uniref:Hemerythrin HHE cation binding domain protein n=1 Tax=Porphyromonas somerae TaxID=322095 RepID=A0A134AZR0_9PORP|nr:PAS domain-containing protein [Porphyromonas somerae]KXB71016.1 hemerythrin HHE cation binding domain protein [Porphyromonadaceae bacterium KA00676]KXB73180.1 hemerythrin HHE cation binding domain protein [Porphyromonas somerae]
MENMRNNLPEIDMEKLQIVLDTKERYLDGKLTLDEARAILRERVKTLRPYEIALAEQELKTFDEDECRKEDIQQMMELFQDVLDRSRPDLPEDHPIMCYLRENDEMRRLLKQVEELAQYPVIKNQWLELYDELHKFRLHLSRKQNQLYSILERKGFDRPTTTMWLLDDFIRDEIRDARRLLEEDKDDEFIAMQPTVVADVLDLMQKEETVLYPTSLAMIRPAEFEEMKSGDHEIGFAWIRVGKEAPKADTSKETTPATAAAGFANELASLLGKYGFGGGSTPGALLEVATGQMTLEQINLVYKHMPVDFSYVDENEIVRFYTDTDHRVFPRSKNVIGRDVKNCHPRTSVHLVEEIVEKFRRGEQNEVDFWINKPGLFIYIYYVAVRDEEGRFRGVLEMMQDCTRIRSLEGSRTLLSWDKSNKAASKHGDDKPAEAAPTAPAPTVEEESEYVSCSCMKGSSHAPAAPEVAAVATEEKTESCGCSGHSADVEITASTRLKDLLEHHPWLKGALAEINPAFKMLSSPLARIMIPKATVGMMSERSGMDLQSLIDAIKKRIAEHK